MTEEKSTIRAAASAWRSRRDEGRLTKEAHAEFQRWMQARSVHAEAYVEAETLWKALGAVEYQKSLYVSLKEPHAAGVMAQACEALLGWGRSLPGIATAAGVTAAAAAMALFVWLPQNAPQSIVAPVTFAYQTGVGEIETVMLADGTEMTLGAKSQVDVVLLETVRRATLHAGDAYFDVAREEGRPFIVTAGAAEVRVTGTAFDMQRRVDVLQVSVAEGSVAVSHPLVIEGVFDALPEWRRGSGGMVESIALTAGERVTASRLEGLGEIEAVRAHDLGAWRSGRLVFHRATLAKIIEDVNRYAETPIGLDDAVRDLCLTATFRAGDTESLLGTLQTALPVAVEIRNGRQWIVKPE